MKIAVLSLQGAFAEHETMLDKLHIDHIQIRNKMDLKEIYDGIIIPGGESTVMAILLKDLELFEPLKKKISDGLPVFGTCAGMILLADHICEEENYGFNTMNITVKRNAYGRQLGSFHTDAEFVGIGEIPMTFIRAPYIVNTKPGVKVMATVDKQIVAARQDNQLVTAFHPELTNDLRIHQYFADMVSGIA